MINIGTNSDTSEFACESIKLWWNEIGRKRYKEATSILILVDCGGSNSYRHHIFKDELQRLANELKIEIRIAHYPPYTSKWNPIEHKLFPHVTRAMDGIILKSYEQVQEVIESTHTEKGLKVTTNLLDRVYEKGKKACETLYEKGTIIFDKVLGALNYKIRPEPENEPA